MMTAFDNNNPAVWRLGPARYVVIRLDNFKIFFWKNFLEKLL